MSREARDWAYSQRLKAPAKPVLVALAEHGERCWPSVARLAEMTGYDARTVRRAIRALEQAGLIDVEQQPGRSASYSLKLSTTPVRESPLSESHPGQSDRGPRSESPGRAVRESGDPGQSDRLTVKEPKRNRKGTGKKQPAIELPEWMPQGLWTDFVEHRRKAKAPMTDIAQRRAISKLEQMRAEGQDIEAVIEQSIINGWKGLFPVKEDRRQPGDSFGNSIEALQSLFGDEHGQEHIPAGHGLPVGGLLERDHEGDGGGVLGPTRRSAG